MSLPRQILEGSMYLVTRRCTQRQFLLKPSQMNNTIFLYCLALAAEKTGVLIHAVCVMSNHYHAVVTDPWGRIPEFMEHLHKYVAKCVNASMGRWESIWTVEQPSLVKLEGDEDVLRKLVYTLTNPVESYLVDRGDKWPGVRTAPDAWLKDRIVAPRPTVFFRENGPTPKVATLELTRPAIFEGLDDEALAERVREAVKTREQELRAEAKEKRIRFKGVREIRAQKPTDTPQSVEPRRNLKPRVAAVNKWRRIEALRRLKSFVEAYRDAWQLWKQGVRDVVFPHGTYALVRHAGVARAPG